MPATSACDGKGSDSRSWLEAAKRQQVGTTHALSLQQDAHLPHMVDKGFDGVVFVGRAQCSVLELCRAQRHECWVPIPADDKVHVSM